MALGPSYSQGSQIILLVLRDMWPVELSDYDIKDVYLYSIGILRGICRCLYIGIKGSSGRNRRTTVTTLHAMIFENCD